MVTSRNMAFISIRILAAGVTRKSVTVKKKKPRSFKTAFVYRYSCLVPNDEVITIKTTTTTVIALKTIKR